MFCLRHFHEFALKRIGRYLKIQCSRRLILSLSSKLKIVCNPNADFVGMYGHKKTNYLAYVKSRTGYVITVADCPLLQPSKLQSETAQTTMEVEVIALAHSCRKLLSKMDIVATLGGKVGFPKNLTILHILIHENNAGALILAETLPSQYTP